MNSTASKKSSPLRTVAVCAVLAVLLLVVVMFVRRKEYPDGTLLAQQRTYFAEQINPDLAEVITAVVPGETTTVELTEKLGEPMAKVEEDGVEVWVYRMRIVKVTERRLVGLIPIGGGTDAVESQMPVGVKDGVVVHTYVTPSKDPAIKAAVEALWGAFNSGT